MSITEKVIFEGVVYITEKPSSGIRIISINNTVFKTVVFTLDLSSSTGAEIEGESSLIVEKDVLPFSKALIATVKLESSYKLSISYKFTVKTPSDDISRDVLLSYNLELQEKIRISREKFKKTDPLSVNNNFFTSGETFIDPFFPPEDSSINLGTSSPIDYPVHWRRPQDFFKGTFKVFETISPNDILQGRLGNCWFMSALGCIAENPRYVQDLLLDSEVNPSGLYRVKINKGGEWVVVVVDDYFPCDPFAGPMFSRSVSNELWVLLIEKAYAKVHGSYSLLRSGQPDRSFMDVTGFPTISYPRDDSTVKALIADNSLWSTSLSFFNMGNLVAINTQGTDAISETGTRTGSGLVPGHSYSIISMKEAQGNQLMNIRNPWGDFEWTGDWSTNSDLWTEEMKEEVKPVLDSTDGAFWMSYSDVLLNFNEIDICCTIFKQEARAKGVFRSQVVDDVKWVFSDKYYTVQVVKNSRVVVSIHQDDERVYGAKYRRKYLNMGFFVLEADQQYSNFVPIYATDNSRDTSVTLDMEVGKTYVILPRVTGVGFTKDPNKTFETFEWVSEGKVHPLFNSAIRDLFRKWNLVVTDQLVFSEFSQMMAEVGISYSQSEFSELLSLFPSYQQGLTPNGLVEFISAKYEELGSDTVREWFFTWGYDDDLFSFKTRFYLVTVHSTEIVIMNENKENFLDYYFKAHEFVLRKVGSSKLKVGGASALCLYEKSDQSFLYGFLNENSYPIQVVCDFSESSGIEFNGKNVFEFNLQPSELKVLTYFEVGSGVGTYNIRTSTSVNKFS